MAANPILKMLGDRKCPSFLELLKSRKSTYDFSSQPVGVDKMHDILEAGRWSPSFRNLQPWEFVVVRNKATIKKLLGSAHYGFYRLDKEDGLPPVLVGLVLKKKYWTGEYGFPSTDKAGVFEAYMSLAMPAMNMMLSAQELGIASCLLNVRESLSYKLVKLEDGDCLPIILCFGYEKPGAKQGKRVRKPLSEIVRAEFSIGAK